MVMERYHSGELTEEEIDRLIKGGDGGDDLLKKGKDGMLARGKGGGTQGVILKSITAIEDDKDYRQEMKVANFQSPDEADEFTSAINECQVLGMSTTPIVDQMIARSAGVKHGLLFEAFRTLTHFSLYTSDNRKDRKHDNKEPKSGSPF